MESNTKNVALLFSGGLDSYISYKVLSIQGYNIIPIFFDLSSRYSYLERIYVSQFSNCIIDNRFDFSKYEKPNAHIDNRNLYLMIAASDYSDLISLGGTASDRISDNDEEIFRMQQDVLIRTLGRDITIFSPLRGDYKGSWVEWFANKFNRYELLLNTFSCYYPTKSQNIFILDWKKKTRFEFSTNECLTCKACFRKCVALYSAGFFIPFFNFNLQNEYLKEFENDNSSRGKNIKAYVKSSYQKWG